MVLQHDLGHRAPEVDGAEDVEARRGVLPDEVELDLAEAARLGEDLGGHGDLADVVDEAGEAQGGLGTGATSALTMDLLRFRRGFDLSGQLGVIFDTGVQSSTDRFQIHASIGARFPIGF